MQYCAVNSKVVPYCNDVGKSGCNPLF